MHNLAATQVYSHYATKTHFTSTFLSQALSEEADAAPGEPVRPRPCRHRAGEPGYPLHSPRAALPAPLRARCQPRTRPRCAPVFPQPRQGPGVPSAPDKAPVCPGIPSAPAKPRFPPAPLSPPRSPPGPAALRRLRTCQQRVLPLAGGCPSRSPIGGAPARRARPRHGGGRRGAGPHQLPAQARGWPAAARPAGHSALAAPRAAAALQRAALPGLCARLVGAGLGSGAAPPPPSPLPGPACPPVTPRLLPRLFPRLLPRLLPPSHSPGGRGEGGRGRRTGEAGRVPQLELAEEPCVPRCHRCGQPCGAAPWILPAAHGRGDPCCRGEGGWVWAGKAVCGWESCVHCWVSLGKLCGAGRAVCVLPGLSPWKAVCGWESRVFFSWKAVCAAGFRLGKPRVLLDSPLKAVCAAGFRLGKPCVAGFPLESRV